MKNFYASAIFTDEKLIFIREILIKDRHWFTIEWTDGKIGSYHLSDLQKRCICARCRDEKTGEIKINPLDIDQDVEAKRIVSIGNYGLQIYFTKGCSKGIYPFWLLRQIGC